MAVLTHLGRFLNIAGEGSPWFQPNVIPAKAGISLRLPRTPTAGLRRRPATLGLMQHIHFYVIASEAKQPFFRNFI